MKVKIEIIKSLDCYVPTSLKREAGKKICSLKNDKKYYKSKENGFFSDLENHYPVILDPDGSLWKESNLYLLTKIKGYKKFNYRTLESLARDLACFRQWLFEEEVDYLKSCKPPRKRPTYRYAFYLHDEVRLQKIKKTTAKRRLSSVVNFYRFLMKKGYEFEYPLWIESDSNSNYRDDRGFSHQRKLISNDLIKSFRTIKSDNSYSEFIDDGGKLRPLPVNEQELLIKALKQVANTEMVLAFYIALTTGARKQTVFTLRKINFLEEPRKNARFVRVKIGGDTLVDSKYDKQMVIMIPIWLYQKIRIYLKSERYKNRSQISSHKFDHHHHQYIFLTRSGRPYYSSKSDPNNSKYSSPPRGNAVTQFIRQQLLPEVAKQDPSFKFRFHDLRATFGMNLLEGRLLKSQRDKASYHSSSNYFQILMYVRERMGHSQISTTEAYLNYKEKYNLVMNLQSEYEVYLQAMMQETEGRL